MTRVCHTASCFPPSLFRFAQGASAVFLDFDRTIASTRRGESPFQGGQPQTAGPRTSAHTIDEDLAALIVTHPRVHIVTRNRHVEDIREFLEGQGLGAIQNIWHVGKGCSKAQVALEQSSLLTGPSSPHGQGSLGRPVVLFVDDDIREHLDPVFTAEICKGERTMMCVHRVLFSRALLTDC